MNVIKCSMVIACLAGGLSAAPSAQALDWIVDPAASALTIQATQTNSPFEGRFGIFEAHITLDPSDLSTAKLHAVIDTGSFESGAPDRDTTAREPAWFDIVVFPNAVFASDVVTNVEGNQYLAMGTLTIKGVSRPVELPFTLDITDGRAVADGTLALNRLDYEVGTGSEWEDGIFVALDVSVSVHIEATAAM